MIAQQPAGMRDLFFVAATPTQSDEPKSYPATLYTTGTGTKLRVVRRMFDATKEFSAIADDLHGTLYLAGSSGVFVIHKDEPAKEDFVSLENFDDSQCWGAVMLDGVRSAIQYCSDKVYRVLGKPAAGHTRVEEGDFPSFRQLQYEGENGGPFQQVPPLAEIANDQLVMPNAMEPKVVLATLPPALASRPQARRLVRVVAATDRYLALWMVPLSMLNQSVDAGNPDHIEPLEIALLNRETNRWRTLEAATTVSSLTEVPARIFGDWMAILAMDWRPGKPGTGSGSPGMQNERTVPVDSHLPDIRDRFYNRFLDLYIPGKVILENLADARKLTLETGQEDTEVLAVRSDGTVLYRVNDSIYFATIEGQHISAPTLVIKDEAVPDVHWAFWRSTGRN